MGFLESNTASIKKAKDVCFAAANGDFEARIVDITETGDLGELMHAINLLIDRTDAYLRESKACLDYVSRNQHFRLIVEKGMVGSFKSCARSINTATHKIKVRHDDFCEMADRLQERLENITGVVSDAINTLRTSSQEVTDSSNKTCEQSMMAAAGAEQVSVNMQNVAASTEELTGSIAEISRQISSSAEIADGAVAKSHAMNEEIDILSSASERISEVVKLISNIADQTNLLALNATIEAARAGESGKGFAIVAQEVKTLASQTADATGSIGKQIDDLQTVTSRAVDANAEIGSIIAHINEHAISIASAVEEQSSATKEISRNVEESSRGTVDVASGVTNAQTVAESTKDAASKVMGVSEVLTEQETGLQGLRSDLGTFLEEARKVG
jgi:methyl-accepting chemotaxis protein